MTCLKGTVNFDSKNGRERRSSNKLYRYCTNK